ncbi:hypothetical protein J5N58_22450 [Rhizobium cremeum]|uniref:hypothetical protein n=1 Tax=Rhizobium cremeum TaxID=2813827 RepID=UPI000DD713FD|nr:hypothetical protein [Rhizobium cremeum]MCJ7997352.1 hypothetical protein [Rhizobium cremeum]MCJ8002446.1 hypothetical protein [Rhizobium cremeum]
MGRANLEAAASASGVRFTVGRDAQGRWVVADRDGLVGGVFIDRASAVHFAMFESDHRPGAVWCVPDHVTLKLGRLFDKRPARQARAAARA